jgi:hypothetical protein
LAPKAAPRPDETFVGQQSPVVAQLTSKHALPTDLFVGVHRTDPLSLTSIVLVSASSYFNDTQLQCVFERKKVIWILITTVIKKQLHDDRIAER